MTEAAPPPEPTPPAPPLSHTPPPEHLHESLVALALSELARTRYGLALSALLRATGDDLVLPQARTRSGQVIDMTDLAVQYNLVNPLTGKVRTEVVEYLRRAPISR